MERTTTRDAIASEKRERWMLTFALDGDLRFISHRDTLRLFQRAFARTSLPVRFTEGFNPHPRLTLPLPRPLGVASDVEALLVEFGRIVSGNQVLTALSRQMPHGIEMLSARRLDPNERPRPVAARYRLDLGDDSPDNVLECIEQILAAPTIVVTRVDSKDGGTRRLDVIPFLEDMRLTEHTVEFVLRIRGDGGVKPAEIAALLGFDARAVNHRIRRTEIQWNQQRSKESLLQ